MMIFKKLSRRWARSGYQWTLYPPLGFMGAAVAGRESAGRKMPEVNEIKIETRNAVTIMDIQGDVTAFSEPFLNDAYQNANDQGTGKILLKFDSNAYINSGGIAVLIQVLAQTQKNKQVIGITGISDHFKKIIHMVGITKFAKIYDSLDDAVKQMSWSMQKPQSFRQLP